MRGKNLIAFLAILTLSFAIISAADLTDFSCKNIEKQKDLAIGQTLPDKAPFTDEIINIYLENETYGNLVIENKTIKDFSCVKNENATYEIFINSSSVIQDFLKSDDLLSTYKEKSDSGEIEIKGIGLGKKFKLFFVKFLLNFA